MCHLVTEWDFGPDPYGTLNGGPVTLLLKPGSCEASPAFPLGPGSYSSHVIIVTQMTSYGHSKEKHAKEKQGREGWNLNLINQPLETGGAG